MAITKRKAAIAAIVTDVAQNGEVTHLGMRAYVENRISMKVFREAIELGIRYHKAKLAQEAQEAAHV